jgi:hypothetical protein
MHAKKEKLLKLSKISKLHTNVIMGKQPLSPKSYFLNIALMFIACFHDQNRRLPAKQEVLVVSALDLLSANTALLKESDFADPGSAKEERENNSGYPAILDLQFPFELKPDQLNAVDA